MAVTRVTRESRKEFMAVGNRAGLYEVGNKILNGLRKEANSRIGGCARLQGTQTTIHGEHLPGHPTLLGREKPSDGTGHFVRLPDATPRMERGGGLEGRIILGQRSGERR